MLTYKQAQQFYDSFGIKQDKQLYEESAIKDLIEHSHFSEAKNIVEFGCGTGKLAARLLNDNLPDDCQYLGLDISQTMVDLCMHNLKPYSESAKCLKIEGKPILNIADHTVDRFISTYVLDLLSDKDTRTLLNEAHRILLPDGYLCLTSLTYGVSFFSRFIITVWNSLFHLKPSIVGGCRPIELTKYLTNDKWDIIHKEIIVSYGVPSEVIIAKRI